MKTTFLNKHLREVKSGYFKHFYYATYFNFISLGIFITGTIHSIFPWWFKYTPYQIAKYLVEQTEKHFEVLNKENSNETR